MAPQHRRKGAAHAERAEIVGFHLQPRARHVLGADQMAHGERTGVVDQYAHVIATRGRRGDLIRIGDVQFHGHHMFRGRVHQMLGVGRVPRADIHTTGARLQKGQHKGLADAAVAARNQHDAVFDLHDGPSCFQPGRSDLGRRVHKMNLEVRARIGKRGLCGY